jgi:RNA polymerase sigma-70 factor (ECF subfamily)
MTCQRPDVEVLLQAARTNPEKMGKLLECYRSFLLLMARCELPGDVDAADSVSDIVQQSFVEACQGFAEFRGETEAEFSAWIKRIHKHNILDAIRRRGASPPVQSNAGLSDSEDSAALCWREPAARQSTPSERIIRGERALWLAEMIASLPEMQREAVRLRHLEGCSVDDIADRLGRSPTAAAGLIKRGLETLRKRMGARADNEES